MRIHLLNATLLFDGVYLYVAKTISIHNKFHRKEND